MSYWLGGVPYDAVMDARRGIVLRKIAHGNLRTDAKGRTWYFNGPTKRWRLQPTKGGKGKTPKLEHLQAQAGDVRSLGGVPHIHERGKWRQLQDGESVQIGDQTHTLKNGRFRSEAEHAKDEAKRAGRGKKGKDKRADPKQGAVDRLVATGNHTPASAKAALQWASEVRTGAEAKMKAQILQQAGLAAGAIANPGESPTSKPETSAPVTADQVLDKIRELDDRHDTDNYLPIHHLRNEFPEVSRDQLNEVLFDLQASDRLEMSTLQDVTAYSEADRKAGIDQSIGGSLFYLSTVDEN